MPYKVTIIKPDNQTEVLFLDEEPGLALLQEWVGGFIELCPLPDSGPDELALYVNEEGRLNNLEHNVLATAYFTATWFFGIPAEHRKTLDADKLQLCGPAVLVVKVNEKEPTP